MMRFAMAWMLTIVLTLAMGLATVRAETAPAAPAAAPAGEAVVATVKSAEGTVEAQTAADRPWTPVRVGQTLGEGTALRTGLRARCELDILGSRLEAKAITLVTLGELRRVDGALRTRVYMKQGTVGASVEREIVKNDFAIQTPAATLSVRGTDGIECGFFEDLGGTYGLTGSGLITVTRDQTGRSTGVQPGQTTNDNATPPILFLTQQFLPPAVDNRAYDPQEVQASQRWNTSTPTPMGLGGTTGSSPIQTIQQIQEITLLPPPPQSVGPSGPGPSGAGSGLRPGGDYPGGHPLGG